MEWKVMFIQSLLILLVVSQVTNACACHSLSLEKAMCPERDNTVVMATIISVEHLNSEGNVVNEEGGLASNARYQMHLVRKIKESGSNPLDVKSDIFTMMFPLDDYLCGRALTLRETYLIVGNVYSDVLYSNTCQVILPQEEVDGNIMSILNGEFNVNC